MAKSIKDLLADLKDAEEKTAEEVFAKGIISEQEKEEKVAEEKTTDEVEEKVASTDSIKEEEKEEKVASETSDDTISSEDLIKIAKGMGKVMAYSCYSELVAMGIMPPTNGDIEFPRVSEVSLPSESPVTVAADAERQVEETKEKIASATTPDVLTQMYTKYFSEEK